MIVFLGKGEHFKPTFLRLNPKGKYLSVAYDINASSNCWRFQRLSQP